ACCSISLVHVIWTSSRARSGAIPSASTDRYTRRSWVRIAASQKSGSGRVSGGTEQEPSSGCSISSLGTARDCAQLHVTRQVPSDCSGGFREPLLSADVGPWIAWPHEGTGSRRAGVPVGERLWSVARNAGRREPDRRQPLDRGWLDRDGCILAGDV